MSSLILQPITTRRTRPKRGHPNPGAARSADVYVFCLNTSRPATPDKVEDPDEWKFWVVPTAVLDNELGGQKTIGEQRLARLVESVSWHEIKASVEACRP